MSAFGRLTDENLILWKCAQREVEISGTWHETLSENKHICLSRSCVESPTLQLQSEQTDVSFAAGSSGAGLAPAEVVKEEMLAAFLHAAPSVSAAGLAGMLFPSTTLANRRNFLFPSAALQTWQTLRHSRRMFGAIYTFFLKIFLTPCIAQLNELSYVIQWKVPLHQDLLDPCRKLAVQLTGCSCISNIQDKTDKTDIPSGTITSLRLLIKLNVSPSCKA